MLSAEKKTPLSLTHRKGSEFELFLPNLLLFKQIKQLLNTKAGGPPDIIHGAADQAH